MEKLAQDLLSAMWERKGINAIVVYKDEDGILCGTSEEHEGDYRLYEAVKGSDIDLKDVVLVICPLELKDA